MKNELISIIIPAYNANAYLSECLESIIGQTYSDLEIIIIDDGSTDNTSAICDQYATKDTRIRVVHQENFGAAAARKRGLQMSNGKYICFVDADDKIESSMIEYFAANISSCDLITAGCYCEITDNEWYKRFDAFASGIYDSESELSYFLRNFITFNDQMVDGILPFLVTKMFKSEIAKEVIKDVDLNITYAEDRDFLFRYILKCKSICVTDECFYYYRNNNNSITRSKNDNFMKDLNNLYLSLKPVFLQHPARNELMHQLQLFILSRIYKITHYMRFGREVQIINYTFPFYNLPIGIKVILYGAGTIGLDYYRHIKEKKEYNLVLWVDKNWERYQDRFAYVASPDCIAQTEYDYIILAVSMKYADEVRKELILKGIPKDKILWENPRRIFD